MKVLVYPHDLGIGGSQINAIEIAGRMAELGHEVVIFGRPGPLVQRVREMGLEFVSAPEPRRRPSPAVMGALAEIVRSRGIEIIHGYEWPPALEGWLTAARLPGVVSVGTVMSMAVAPFLPRDLPLVVGTEQIAHVENLRGRNNVSVIEPPVDLALNRPGSDHSAAEFRTRWGLVGDALNVVVVTRLVEQLKLEGLLTAIDVIPRLPAATPLRLIVVGGGPAEGEIRKRAEHANRAVGRRAVLVTGELADPRPAYQAADIVLGMGSSALRALAFAKPLVVQGERGFWSLLTPETLPDFQWTGWYGIGSGPEQGAEALRRALRVVIDDRHRRTELGEFGRSVAESRYGLEAATLRQMEVYRRAFDSRTPHTALVADSLRSGAGFLVYKGRRRAARILGRAQVDDFNSRPVALTGPGRPVTPS